MFIIIWEFQVHESSRAPFEALYGAEGAWVALFGSDPAYRGTELLRDHVVPGRYLTIDRWDSAQAYHAFKRNQAEAYAALDARGEGLTTSERLLGEFDLDTR
jgi:heme-degrading monooxygenase HmoA